MAQTFDVGDLKLYFVNEIQLGRRDEPLTELVKRAVRFQRQVFTEQGVPNLEDKVLPYSQSVGNKKEPGSLTEKGSYGHLIAVHSAHAKQPIGMRVTEIREIADLGMVVLDHYPALVRMDDLKEQHEIDISSIYNNVGSRLQKMNLAEILMNFSRHVPSSVPIMARFTDGTGIGTGYLQKKGFLKCEIGIRVPSLDAETLRQYNTPAGIQPIYGKFGIGVSRGLSPEAAEDLIVKQILIGGYVDLIGDGPLVNVKGRMKSPKVDDLKLVKEARQRIADAVADHGSVRFEKF